MGSTESKCDGEDKGKDTLPWNAAVHKANDQPNLVLKGTEATLSKDSTTAAQGSTQNVSQRSQARARARGKLRRRLEKAGTKEKILKQVFPQVRTLYEVLVQHPDIAPSKLLVPSDPKKYKHILKRSLVGLPGKDSRIPSNLGSGNYTSQVDIVDSVIQQDLDRNVSVQSRYMDGMAQNVVSLGYRNQRNDWRETGGSIGMQGIINVFPNTVVNELKRGPWAILHLRIGDEIMHYVLSNFSIFVPLHKNSYLQITGCPLPGTIPKGADLDVAREEAFTRKSIGRDRKEDQGQKKAAKAKKEKTESKAQSAADAMMIDDKENTHPNSQRRDCGADDSVVSMQNTLVNNQKIRMRKKVFDVDEKALHRYRLFYSNDFTERLPYRFPYLRFNVSRNAAQALIMHIYDIKTKTKTVKRLPRQLKGLVPILLESMRRWKHTSFVRILDHHCPLPPGIRDGSATYEDLIQSFCSFHSVERAMQAILKAFLPTELFGDVQNERTFYKNLGCYLRLRRHEKYTVEDVMRYISLSKVQWLGPTRRGKGHSQSRKMLCTFLAWLYLQVVNPIIKACFYVTESSAHRNRLFYYRKSTWKSAVEICQNELAAQYQPIGKRRAERILNETELEYAVVRFQPKSGGPRPIANMAHRRTVRDPNTGRVLKKVMSTNQMLQQAFQVLSFERRRQPGLVGGAVFGIDEIYDSLVHYVTASHFNPKVRHYFASVDISKAFDTVLQEKLLKITNNIMQETTYMIRRYFLTIRASNRLRAVYKKSVSPVSQFEQFPELATKLSLQPKVRNAIITDLVICGFENADHVLELMRNNILRNIIRVGSQFYIQIKGIPQGSVLSTLLCNFYYGHMEKHVLPQKVLDNGHLMRQIDDFLLITPSRSAARAFLDTMMNGVPEYGCTVNPKKTAVSFTYAHENCIEPAVHRKWFPWCGFLINTMSLNVMIDYTRYAGTYMSDTLTVDTSERPGAALQRKMFAFFKTKCHPLLLDKRLNSEDTIAVNVFQLMALCAVKFHCHVRHLRQNHRPNERLPFMVSFLDSFLVYCHTVLNNLVKAYPGSQCTMGRTCIRWLCAKAFIAVLTPKQAVHRHLLEHLKTMLKKNASAANPFIANRDNFNQIMEPFSMMLY
eukprot:Clim_evm104s172 gene=Clim_evmTU104s172